MNSERGSVAQAGAGAWGIDGLAVGMWTHPDGHTGTTVLLPPEGTVGAAAVRGGAPGTREVAALSVHGRIEACHGIVLSGGSAFGLAAADGAVRWCAEQGIGHDVGVARVPIIGAAIVFDLRAGDAARPDADAGYAACAAAAPRDPRDGLVGVGAGCTVGKLAGLAHAVPGGQGAAVRRAAGCTVGALVAVNALGDVLDEQGAPLAASTAPADRPRYPEAGQPRAGTNTVIGCVVTDAALSKADAVRAADLAHSGVARSVSPAHTSYDGDVLFLLATGRGGGHLDLVADLAARAVAAAVRAAVRAGARDAARREASPPAPSPGCA